MSLEQWLQNAWLQRVDTTVSEIQQLFQVVDRDLQDAGVQSLSPDGRFQHAYDASLQLCMIPLRACGYRVVKGQSHHKRAIDSLQFTLGKNWSETADHIERSSRLRAQTVYERVGAVSERDALDLINTANQLRSDVVNWLHTQYPKLLPPKL